MSAGISVPGVGFVERRGTLNYLTADFEVASLVGHFRVRNVRGPGFDKFVVIARRKGGRNNWQLCDDKDVLSFHPGEGFSDGV